MSDDTKPDLWAIVEIYGHQRIAGKISEQTIGGCSFLRVDVPAVPQRKAGRYGDVEDERAIPGFTKLFGNGAIFSISFVDEMTATLAAHQFRAAPIDSYTISDALRSMDSSRLKALLEAPRDASPED